MKNYFNTKLCITVFQGKYPLENTRYDGHEGLSPVNAYPVQNSYGKRILNTSIPLKGSFNPGYIDQL